MLLNRRAFTMIELIFVIVIISILATVALPKLSISRDDALIVNGKATLAAVRAAITTERQKRVLRGDFTNITDLSSSGSGQIFTTFNADNRGVQSEVLAYPLKSGTSPGMWQKSGSNYTFYHSDGSCAYVLNSFKLIGSCVAFGD